MAGTVTAKTATFSDEYEDSYWGFYGTLDQVGTYAAGTVSDGHTAATLETDMAVEWVASDNLPALDLTVSPIPSGYTLAGADTITVGARPHAGGTALTASATVVDTDTVRVQRTDLALTAGVWSVEVEAEWSDGSIRTWPDGNPLEVRVREQIVEA